jgi:hypothetical protein
MLMEPEGFVSRGVANRRLAPIGKVVCVLKFTLFTLQDKVRYFLYSTHAVREGSAQHHPSDMCSLASIVYLSTCITVRACIQAPILLGETDGRMDTTIRLPAA